MKLRFQFDPIKFVNAVAYLAERSSDSTKMTICKQLFFADKRHVQLYGRPVVGDQYYKLPHGPCPTRGLDLLRKKADAASHALLDKYIEIDGKFIRTRRSADRKVFSKSELKILDWVISKYGAATGAQLRAITHKDPAYKKTEPKAAIDYALFFEEIESDETIQELAEDQQDGRDALRPYVHR